MTSTVNSGDFSTSRSILSRSLISDYFSITQLPRKLGAEIDSLPLALIKELVENSLDACEEEGIKPEIKVAVQKIDDYLVLRVEDNGPGLRSEAVEKIIDFSRFHSSRHFYKYPTRGAFGNAYKCIIASHYVVADELGIPPIENPLRIISRGFEYDVGFNRENERATVKTFKSNVSTVGTIVSLKLPILKPDWLKSEQYVDLIENFSTFNPHSTFIVTTPNDGKGLQYVATSPTLAIKEVRESIHWFSLSEFQARVEAEIQSKDSNYKVPDFIQQFRGFSDKSPNLPVKHLHELHGDSSLIRELYTWMRMESEPPKPALLDKYVLGRTHFTRLGATKYASKELNPRFEGGDVYVPSIVEVAIFTEEVSERQVVVAINRSPKVESPFRRTVFGVVRLTGSQSIESILESNGIRRDSPVRVVIHVVCPNLQYRDDGKTILNLEPFANLGQIIYDATKGYRRWGKAKAPEGAPKNAKKAVCRLLGEAIRLVSSDGKYRYKQRQLFYVLRQLIDQRYPHIELSYGNLTQEILPDASRAGFNLAGMLKEANSELTEPRGKTVSLSTDEEENYIIYPWRARFAIFSEKRGMIDLLEAERFHDKYDALLYGSQGQPSVATRVNLKRWKKSAEVNQEPFSIFVIHDADVAGHIIARTLREPTDMMPEHHLHVVDLGLTMVEAVNMGLKPERVVKKPGSKRGESQIPKELVADLPIAELALLIGLTSSVVERKKGNGEPFFERYRIELNQLTSEEFLGWLIGKLGSYGVLNKVRPPDAVVDDRTREEVGISLEAELQKALLDLCGFPAICDELSRSLQGIHEIDVKKSLNDELDHMPLEGWDDIVRAEVNERMKIILAEPLVMQSVVLKIIRNLQSHNTKNGRDFSG